MGEYINWYDNDKVEKLREVRTKKYIGLVKKWRTAKEKEDKEAIAKAFKAMSKHKDADRALKEKAESVGSYWY